MQRCASNGTNISGHSILLATSMLTTLNTERLNLDIITLEDHTFMFELVNSRGWLDFIGNRNVNSKEDAIGYINKIHNTPHLTYWVLRTKSTNTPIGIISFIKRSYLEHYDIGFALLPGYHGKGYAHEAAKAVLLMLSQDSLYSTILATLFSNNIRSIQLLTKLGFRFHKEIEVENDKLHVYSNR